MAFKKINTVLITLSIIGSSFLPFFAEPAEAQFGFGIVHDPIHTTVTTVESTRKTIKDVLDAVAMRIAQLILDRIVSSTVKWAQSGFDGNPAYATNPEQYFADIGDGIAGQFIRGSDLGFLCSPFQANIRLSLAQEYYEPEPFQCTLTQVLDNTESAIEDFYNDFSQGGWGAWFSMTQNPTNNPYGAYLKAKIELDSQIASAVRLKREQLNWNQGFLSWQTCKAKNPPLYIDVPGGPDTLPSKQINPAHVQGKAEGECIQYSEIKTPGSTIKAQLDKVLPSGLEKIVKVEHVEQLVEAFAVGVLKRYVFGPKGLFDSSNDNWREEGGNALPGTLPGGRVTQIDTDGDGVVDGSDTNGDGEIDICYFGGKNDPTGPPCKGSTEEVKTPTGNPGGGGSASCPAPTTPASLCRNVSQNTVLGILEQYPATNEGITAALPAIQAIYGSQVKILEHPIRLDKIDFGGGMIVDVVVGSGGPNPSWGWLLECNCGGGGTGGGSGGGGTGGGGTGGGGTGGGGGTQTPGTPTITSVTPTTARPGVTTLTIIGTNLTSTVQFFDGSGGRNTVVGSVNSTGTQTTVTVPSDLPVGNATVKVYRSASSISNGILILISNTGSGGGSTINTAVATQIWAPTQTTNGWWPSLSPNGRYVTYGNWGESWVTDLESSDKQTWNFGSPAGLPAGARCLAGQWLSDTKMTFVCEITPTSFWRYEVTVGEWTVVKTADDPTLVAGNVFKAEDNHWASYLAAQRIAKDNQILVSGGTGGALAISGNTLIHSCTNDGTSVCVRNGTSLTQTYTARTPIHNMALKNGYILYGGYGPVRGITPSGVDFDLTVSPWRRENTIDILLVDGAIWTATTSWNENASYILLRPWASRSTIALSANASSVSISYGNGKFTIAYNDDRGAMRVITVPKDAPRHQF